MRRNAKQAERKNGRRNAKPIERKNGRPRKGGNPEEEKKDGARAVRFAGSGNGAGGSA